MTIQHIGKRAITLYIPEHELVDLAMSPAAIGKPEALKLLEIALEDHGFDGWETAELEIYAGQSAVLLFARRKSGSPRHFYFGEFEQLISAAHLCPEALPSTLCRLKGGYLLTVYPFEGDAPPPILSEYGQELGSSAYLTAHLAEQDAALLPTGALARLRTHF
ncbi:MAG: adaptor protein MecA [Oscillospiraceae bacterium]|nr:adaptor protein MecA [Oscillospiraceae bacterium]